MESQELLLDICNIALFQLSATALFISLSTVTKYLIRPDSLYLRRENPVEAALPGPAGFGEGTEAEGAEAPSRRVLTMLFQRLIMNPLRTRSDLEKS